VLAYEVCRTPVATTLHEKKHRINKELSVKMSMQQKSLFLYAQHHSSITMMLSCITVFLTCFLSFLSISCITYGVMGLLNAINSITVLQISSIFKLCFSLTASHVMHIKGKIMPRLTITFSTDVYNQFQENAAQKQIPVAHYARSLIDIGLRVEEAAAQNGDGNIKKKSEIDELGDLKKLWESDLSWILESLYLIRFLIRYLINNEKLSSEDNNNHIDEIINAAKNKAQSYVNGFLGGKI
jgi:hypothetical protein